MIGKYKNIYLIISPPRCASTALARAFWHQPSIRYYSHEPFELNYYEEKSLTYALDQINNPIDLKSEYEGKIDVIGNDLVIKEMTFQVGDLFPELLKIVNTPVIFLIRDPRLNISSRISKIKEAGKQKVNFPLVETGWEFIQKQVNYCNETGKEYYIVEASDFRSNPDQILEKLFNKLKLPFEKNMLNWEKAKNIKLDNLDGVQTNFYTRVLESDRVLPPTEEMPDINVFSEENGMKSHVITALEIYKKLLENKNRI